MVFGKQVVHKVSPVGMMGDQPLILPNHSGIQKSPDALNKFVPYTGALNNVILGNKSLSTTSHIDCNNIISYGSDNYAIVAYPGHKYSILGNIHGNSFDGTGFAFSNWSAGSNVFGMVHNADNAFFGSPISGTSSMILGWDESYMGGGAGGYLGLAEIIANTKAIIGTNGGDDGTGAPLQVAGNLSMSGPITFLSDSIIMPDYNSIVSPFEGMTAWDYGAHTLMVFDGMTWVAVT